MVWLLFHLVCISSKEAVGNKSHLWNKIFVLTIEHTDSDLKVHALHYANELLVRVRLFQKLLQTRLICRNNWKKCLGKDWWHVLEYIPRKTTFRFIFYHNINDKENVFFQSASWKRHCVTHWHEQCGRDSYLPRQISQSDCKISSNCGKNSSFFCQKMIYQLLMCLPTKGCSRAVCYTV